MQIELINVYRHHLIDGKKYYKLETACFGTPMRKSSQIKIRTGILAGKVVPKYTIVEKDKELCGLVVPSMNLLQDSQYNDINDFIDDYIADDLDFEEMIFELKTSDGKSNIDYNVLDSVKEELRKRQPQSLEEEFSGKVFLGDLVNYYNELSKNILGQDLQLKIILGGIYSWQKSIDLEISKDKKRLLKNNMFIIGASGSGKTEMFRQISSLINIPMVIEDANRYTIEGYVGKSVDDMLLHLIEKCDGNISKAERGIIVIDEVDKLGSISGDERVSTSGVQDALNTVMEGGEYVVGNSRGNFGPQYTIDTTNIQFILLGSFDKLMVPTRNVGFGAIQNKHKSYLDIKSEDLIKMGMNPEIVGRCTVIVGLNNYTVEDYKRIMIESKYSFLKVKREMYELKGIELVITDEFIDILSKKVEESRIGVRAVKNMLSLILSVADYEINIGNVKRIVLDESTFNLGRAKVYK